MRAVEQVLGSHYRHARRRQDALPDHVYISWDRREEERGPPIRVEIDLDEPGSMALYRVVCALVGYYKSGSDFRLIGSRGASLSLSTRRSPREAGMKSGQTLTLAGRLRGGADDEEPPPSGSTGSDGSAVVPRSRTEQIRNIVGRVLSPGRGKRE